MGDSVLGEERLASISSAIANDVYNRLCRWEGVEPGCLQDIKDTMLDNKTAIFNNFTQVQTCLATNQVVAGCEKFLQKVESSSTFCIKMFTRCAFYPPKANLFCNK